MFLRLSNPYDHQTLAYRMRRRRVARFFELVAGWPGSIRVLDVGGTTAFWEPYVTQEASQFHITLLNLDPPKPTGIPHITSIQGDARNMRHIETGSFDVCFSNSVIEHVGTLFDQKAMADEVRRVAPSYFVQTPNRNFPVEPHFHLPGWQWLPVWIRTYLLRRWRFGWHAPIPDPFIARAEVEQIRLLNRRELTWLFPDATIECEKLGPLTKSFLVWKMTR